MPILDVSKAFDSVRFNWCWTLIFLYKICICCISNKCSFKGQAIVSITYGWGRCNQTWRKLVIITCCLYVNKMTIFFSFCYNYLKIAMKYSLMQSNEYYVLYKQISHPHLATRFLRFSIAPLKTRIRINLYKYFMTVINEFLIMTLCCKGLW